MNSNHKNISIIIIGYNTLSTLPDTLNSINLLKVDNQNIEVIYIDDGSTDGSYEYFKITKLNFKKSGFCFKKNSGRVAARAKGIEMASGEWLLFLNSNVAVNSKLILRYSESISENNAYMFGGSVHTCSNDSIFEKYLNHPHRGINQYENNQKIKYQNLIFNNCMIKKIIFNTIEFNPDFRYYGGEELDFAYRVDIKHPNMMRAAKNAAVTRINHPNYKKHLYRLIEFGQTNFNYLNDDLKQDVIKWDALLIKNIVFRGVFNLLYHICRQCYKIPLINDKIIRLGMLSAILTGYYKTK